MEALKACHATGIVHRDVKPQNVILSDPDRRAKLIDLGAAADLRIGINYVPNEFLLDPRYAPPEQYIMSTQVRRKPYSLMCAASKEKHTILLVGLCDVCESCKVTPLQGKSL